MVRAGRVALLAAAAALQGVEHEEEDGELRRVLDQDVDVPHVAPPAGEGRQGLALCWW